MKKIIYILLLMLIYGCTVKYYTVETTTMLEEAKVLKVKKHRAKCIKKRLKKIGLSEPKYKEGEMTLYFEHLDSTIRFSPKEIKQLQK